MKQNYVSSFHDKIATIENALETSDFQVLSTIIHQMIGSSGSYGLMPISLQCLKIENHLHGILSVDSVLSSDIGQLIKMMRQEALHQH